MRLMNDRSIMIVGGGFSGSALAIQLAHRGIASTIIESRNEVARGAAYSTSSDEHLLNVNAGKMSLWPDKPSDFAEHLGGEGLGPQDFVSRRRFGDYVEAQLASASENGRVTLIRDRAIAARPSDCGWSIDLANGETVSGIGLVLANGNQPPAPMLVSGLEQSRRIEDPWSAEGRAAIAQISRGAKQVLLLGTGLTMVDVALTLDSAGFAGKMTALSRRGQLPRTHQETGTVPIAIKLDDVPRRLSKALHWMRQEVARADEWRAVMDGLRPVTQSLWQRMGVNEQSRFLRHLRPWWDVHRHRIAPQAACTITRLLGDGQLEILAGRINRAIEADDGARIEIGCRGGGNAAIKAEAVVNCTGSLARIDQSCDLLIQQMIADGMIAADSLGIGIEVDELNRLPGLSWAWAIGPVTKGRYWEITAVPDIRVQVEMVADRMADALLQAA